MFVDLGRSQRDVPYNQPPQAVQEIIQQTVERAIDSADHRRPKRPPQLNHPSLTIVNTMPKNKSRSTKAKEKNKKSENNHTNHNTNNNNNNDERNDNNPNLKPPIHLNGTKNNHDNITNNDNNNLTNKKKNDPSDEDVSGSGKKDNSDKLENKVTTDDSDPPKLTDNPTNLRKYEVLVQARVRTGESLDSHHITDLPEGTVVTVEEMKGRRARIIDPIHGWLSATSKFNARIIMPLDRNYAKIGARIRWRDGNNRLWTGKVVDYSETSKEHLIRLDEQPDNPPIKANLKSSRFEYEDPSWFKPSSSKVSHRAKQQLSIDAPHFDPNRVETAALFNRIFQRDYPGRSPGKIPYLHPGAPMIVAAKPKNHESHGTAHLAPSPQLDDWEGKEERYQSHQTQSQAKMGIYNDPNMQYMPNHPVYDNTGQFVPMTYDSNGRPILHYQQVGRHMPQQSHGRHPTHMRGVDHVGGDTRGDHHTMQYTTHPHPMTTHPNHPTHPSIHPNHTHPTHPTHPMHPTRGTMGGHPSHQTHPSHGHPPHPLHPLHPSHPSHPSHQPQHPTQAHQSSDTSGGSTRYRNEQQQQQQQQIKEYHQKKAEEYHRHKIGEIMRQLPQEYIEQIKAKLKDRGVTEDHAEFSKYFERAKMKQAKQIWYHKVMKQRQKEKMRTLGNGINNTNYNSISDIPNPYNLPSDLNELRKSLDRYNQARQMEHPLPKEYSDRYTQEQWQEYCQQHYNKKYKAVTERIKAIKEIKLRKDTQKPDFPPNTSNGGGTGGGTGGNNTNNNPRPDLTPATTHKSAAQSGDRNSKGLMVLRGLPGSGKTTLAKKLARRSHDAQICTEDKYHWSGKEDGVGEYKFQPSLVFQARDWCTQEIRGAIERGVHLVILDNHNARISMYEEHIQFAVRNGYRFRIIEFIASEDLIDKYRARSYKKFPREVYAKLLNLWENDPRAELINPTFSEQNRESNNRDKISGNSKNMTNNNEHKNDNNDGTMGLKNDEINKNGIENVDSTSVNVNDNKKDDLNEKDNNMKDSSKNGHNYQDYS